MNALLGRATLVALSLCGLFGCASPGQIAAQHDQTCQSYRLLPGTPEYAACRVQLADTQRAQQAEAFRRFGQALSSSANCSNMPAGQAFACGYTAGSQ